MPKVKYNDITFDSELEVEYYKYLEELWHKGGVNWTSERVQKEIKIHTLFGDEIIKKR